MSDLISRKEAINIIKDYFNNLIMEQPTEIDEDGEEVFTSTAKINEFLTHNKELCKKIYYLPKNVPDTNVGELISRQEVIDEIWKLRRSQQLMDDTQRADLVMQGIYLVEKAVEKLPSVQPETAKRIVGKSRDGMTFWYQCDMCNEPVDAQDNFCRGCGRRLIDG